MWPPESRAYTFIRNIVLYSKGNCSAVDPPSGRLFIEGAEVWQRVLLGIAAVLTIFVLLLSVLHWFCVWSYVSVEQRRNKLYFLLSLFPVSCVCCLVGLCLPRAAVVLTSIGVLYYLLCLFVIVSLCRHLFGGRDAMCVCLRRERTRIDFRSPPFCCVLPARWLPTAAASEKNVCRVEWMVLQAPVVRALIVAADTVIIAEMRDDAAPFLKWTDTGAVVSLLLAIFGVHSMARMTAPFLTDFCFMTVFRLVDISLLFFTAQQPMIFENILLRFELIGCGKVLSAESNAKFVCSFVNIVQMFLLSVAASLLLAPHRCALFDLFPSRKSPVPSTIIEPLTDESP